MKSQIKKLQHQVTFHKKISKILEQRVHEKLLDKNKLILEISKNKDKQAKLV